ncbi:hypothetical protein OK836_11275, partial [Streptococcus pneumoniae]|nr:hypothetical protein [Streptococcus pneumoniae]
PLYYEWLIVNPAAIEAATADPAEILSVLKAQAPKFRADPPTFEPADIYGGRDNDLYYSRAGLKFVRSVLNLVEKSDE